MTETPSPAGCRPQPYLKGPGVASARAGFWHPGSGARPLSTDIKAVIFDAGNTLVYVDPQRMLDIFADAGVDDSSLERFAEAERKARARLARKVEEGASGTESHIWKEYFLNLFRWAGVPEDLLDGVGQRVVEIHEREHLWTHVAPGTHDTLERLRQDGYRMAVVSNADGRVEGLLEQAGLRPYFEFVIDSHLVEVEKPDPRIFRHALERLELDPGECLYVGDLYPVDVVGARNAGLEALLLDPHGSGGSEAEPETGQVGREPVDTLSALHELPAYLAERR